MPNSKFTSYDPEAAAKLGLEDERIYPLPACVLPFGELEPTDAASDAPATKQLDLDVRAAVGIVDEGEEHLTYIADALQAAFALRKAAPAKHPLRDFYGCPAAHDEAVIDLLRWYGVPHVTIDKFMGRAVDRTVKRLLVPCEEARRLDQLEADTRLAMEADAKRAAVQSAFEQRVENRPCLPDRYWQGRPATVPGFDGNPIPNPGPTAHFTDEENEILWCCHALMPGKEFHLKSRADRPVIRPGDPQPFPNKVLAVPPLEMTAQVFDDLERATKAAKRGLPVPSRPEPSLRHVALFDEFLDKYLHKLMGQPYTFWTRYLVEIGVRGLGLPVITVVERIKAKVLGRCGGKYPWNIPSPEILAELAVKTFESKEPEAMVWLCLAPVGVVDRMAEKIASWTEPLRRFFAGKEHVSTPEIEAELGQELSPVDHQAIFAIAKDAGYRKTRIQENGQRSHQFVKQ